MVHLTQVDLYYSTIADKDAWSTLDFLQIGVDDGDIVTGMVAFANRLYVFKRFSIYRVRFHR